MSGDNPKVGIVGCMGRMGQAIATIVKNTEALDFYAGSEVSGHPWIGKTYPKSDAFITDDAELVFSDSDIVIDFTPPGNTVRHASFAQLHRTKYIVGTTGLDDIAHRALDEAGAHTVVVQAGNFSLGVNLMVAITKRVASLLDDDWDIEILEMHHRHKIDAPSGTAIMIGEAAALGRGVDLEKKGVVVRDGITGEREAGDIGFVSLRGGSVIGEHEAIFASDSERLTIAHRAENRGLFAKGAVKAALWAHQQDPGRFDMMDVLSLEDW